ncbi:MAG: LSU ribosomal protein L35p, partial [uncultured Solirubrobacteraceae bacterium]
AEDEVALGRQEALQAHGHRQGAGAPRLLEPHPREEVAEAQAQLRPRHRAVEERSASRQAHARGQRAM